MGTGKTNIPDGLKKAKKIQLFKNKNRAWAARVSTMPGSEQRTFAVNLKCDKTHQHGQGEIKKLPRRVSVVKRKPWKTQRQMHHDSSQSHHGRKDNGFPACKKVSVVGNPDSGAEGSGPG